MGTQLTLIQTNETREAKLNRIHTRQEILKVKQEVTHTEKQTKTHGLDTGTETDMEM